MNYHKKVTQRLLFLVKYFVKCIFCTCTCVVAVVKLATSCICFCDEQVDREFEREVARFNQ